MVTTRALKLVHGATVMSTRLIAGVYVHPGTSSQLHTLLPFASVSMRDYLALVGGAKYCDEHVCLSVCLSVRSRNSKTARQSFTNFLHVACGRGSVSAISYVYTSGFVDDVMFSYHGASEPESSRTLFRRVRQVAVPVGRRTTTVFDPIHQNAAPGGVCYLPLTCWGFERERTSLVLPHLTPSDLILAGLISSHCYHNVTIYFVLFSRRISIVTAVRFVIVDFKERNE